MLKLAGPHGDIQCSCAYKAAQAQLRHPTLSWVCGRVQGHKHDSLQVSVVQF
jgi:hypothetical protein